MRKWLPLAGCLVAGILIASELHGETQRNGEEVVSPDITEMRTAMQKASAELVSLRSLVAARASTEIELDHIPFRPDTVARWVVFPRDASEAREVSRDDVPPAPVGDAALTLSRQLKWPSAWGARHRPQLFLLGAAETGTTELSACMRVSMTGSVQRRPYPLARMRWPVSFGPGGEPLVDQSTPLRDHCLWNRTGFRRWDAPDAWGVYTTMGLKENQVTSFFQKLRFPPVEERSAEWVVSDATPGQLMVPEAADAAFRDLNGAPWTLRFLVHHRDPLDRARAHYNAYVGSGKAATTSFEDVLHAQNKRLRSIHICEMMLRSPDELMRDVSRVRTALASCMVDASTGEPMFLPLGFAAMGVRYWKHVFRTANFSAVTHQWLARTTADDAMAIVEDAFNLTRLLPRCNESASWRLSEVCTGQRTYDSAVATCTNLGRRDDDTRQGNLTISPGSPLGIYKATSDRWSIILRNLLEESRVRLLG